MFGQETMMEQGVSVDENKVLGLGTDDRLVDDYRFSESEVLVPYVLDRI